jgi:hypothetical protein
MKKITLSIIALALLMQPTLAQFSLDVKKVELSGNGKSKQARIVSSDYDVNTKKTSLKFFYTLCEGSETSYSDSRYFEADGLAYTFETLNFDADFNFLNLEKSNIAGLANALKVAPVLGPDFNISSPYGYVVGANKQGGWLSQHKLYTKTVATTKYNNFYCDEVIEARKGDLQIPFPAEGVMFNKSVANGVYVATQNSQAETTVNTGFYDHDGKKIKSGTFKVNYAFASIGFLLTKEDGSNDLVFILQPTTKYNKYGIKVDKLKANTLEFEYIRIDGSTFAIKERFTFNAKNSQWYVESAIERNGAVYLFGQASDGAEPTPYGFGGFSAVEGKFDGMVSINKLENYQIAKIKSGKAEYVNSFSPEDMQKVQRVVEGSKGKSEPNGFFRLQEIKFLGERIFITAQSVKNGSIGDDRSQTFMMMINEQGAFTNLFSVPKENYANTNMFFSADNKTLMWAIYDYSKYEIQASKKVPAGIKLGFYQKGDDHTFLGKRKNDDGPLLQLVKIDLTTNKASALQTCGEEEYTLYDDYPVLYSNGQEVVFLGTSGKNKERYTNVIKAKF